MYLIIQRCTYIIASHLGQNILSDKLDYDKKIYKSFTIYLHCQAQLTSGIKGNPLWCNCVLNHNAIYIRPPIQAHSLIVFQSMNINANMCTIEHFSKPCNFGNAMQFAHALHTIMH
jgi:hypothetical protein